MSLFRIYGLGANVYSQGHKEFHTVKDSAQVQYFDLDGVA